MKRLISALLVLIFVALAPAASVSAGSRYHSHSYSNHYYGGYRGHYYPYSRHSYHHSDRFLAHLGVGLLAGAVVGSILYNPPAPRTVVYAPPPPVIVQSAPVIVRQQPTYYPPPTDTILRQVKSTVHMLNVRSGPGLDEEVIGQVVLGEVLGVIGAAPEWLYVMTAEGRRGWVMTQYTQDVDGPVG
jgi:uncharacterized protein YgiM (DUF1202 family)